MRHTNRLLLITAIILGAAVSTASAQFPRTMSYQGIVADDQGQPMTGSHQMTISLYTSPTGGAPVYSETHSNVNFVRGLYNITIGSITPIPPTLSFNTPYYLGVTLDGGTEIPQRTALTAVPYALYADTANSAKTATRATTADDLGAGANVVRSLNGQSGQLEIIGGGSTTVTRTGNTITIFSRDTSGSGATSPITSVQPLDRSITVQNFFGPNVGIKIRENGVNTEQLADNAVITPKIIDEAITTAKLANFSVTTSKLVDGAVTTSKIANLAITNALLAANAVTTDKIMDGTIQTVDLADGSVTNPKLAPNAVTTDKIFDGTIQTVDLADGSVTNPKLAANAVTTDKIMDGQVQTADILNLNVTNAKLAADAVTTDKIMDGQVQTNDIANLNVTNAKLAADAVTTDKIQDGQVQTNDIANLNVTTAKLADGSVTNPKLGADAVTTDKILDLTVGTNDIANLAVTNGKIGANAVDAGKISTAGATTNGQALMFNGGVSPVWGSPAAGDLILPFAKTQSHVGPLFSITNSGVGPAANFSGSSTALTVSSSGILPAVVIANTGNGASNIALDVTSAGSFYTTTIVNSNTTNGNGLFSQITSSGASTFNTALYGYSGGTRGYAGYFYSGNTASALSTVVVNNAGASNALNVFQNNTTSSADAVVISNSGLGDGLTVNSVAGGTAALQATSTDGFGVIGHVINSSAPAKTGVLGYIGPTYSWFANAGVSGISVNGPGVGAISNTNFSSALVAAHTGTNGSAISAFVDAISGTNSAYALIASNVSSGGAASIRVDPEPGVTNNAIALNVYTNGGGRAGYFQIDNSASSSVGLEVVSDATAPGIWSTVTNTAFAIRATSTAGNAAGVVGSSGSGLTFIQNSGVAGYSANGQGTSGITANGAGIYGGVSVGGTGRAGDFNGNVRVVGNLQVTGTVSKGGGSFMIDHPLDPENKYLYHSFVESPNMMNIYDGIALLDDKGEATVEMPEWFEALNGEYRYQLTCIGGYAQVYIAEEISGNTFRIAGGKPGMKVSWQVTGTRHDAYSRKHRVPLEVEKPAEERGTYVHPDAFGSSAPALGIVRQHVVDTTAPARPERPDPIVMPEIHSGSSVEQPAGKEGVPPIAPPVAPVAPAGNER